MNSPSAYGIAIATAVTLVLASGCAMQAPRYQPSIDNVELLKKAAGQVAVGTFTVQSGAPGVTAIGLRGSSMISPVGADYAAYLAEGLRQELSLAGKLDSNSKVQIRGLLLKNDISAGGVSTNSGEIEARIEVLSDGRRRYERSHRAELTWESSFFGAVAIPKAQQQYPLLVQQLLRQLMSDSEFMEAMK